MSQGTRTAPGAWRTAPYRPGRTARSGSCDRLGASFGALFVGLVDPGGTFGYRVTRMVAFALMGAGVTVLAFRIASAAWGWVVVVAYLVTLGAGLTVRFGAHRFVAATLLNVWCLIAVTLPAGYAADHTVSHTWAQALAWLAGSAFWIAITFAAWLARGRHDRTQPVPEIPGDISPRELTKPMIAYALLRAVAIAIPFGLDLPNADWMPIAALVAMRPSLPKVRSSANNGWRAPSSAPRSPR